MMNIKLGKYKHYKGFICEVIGIARHTETLEEMVIYKHDSSDYGKDSLWARPAAMFAETVKINGEDVPRFTFVG